MSEAATKLLRVVAPNFVAGAVWQKAGGRWRCIEAAPILKWMPRYTPEQVALYLRRRGWSWTWH